MKSHRLQLITLNILYFFLIVVLIEIILIHAKTGFISRSYGEKIPEWDNTRELLDWGNIAKVLTKNLPQRELGSLATLNWYDSGQLSSAFDYEHFVGVIGPNSNHFKYINLMKGNFATLIDVRLINHYNDIDLRRTKSYGYKIMNRMELPFLEEIKNMGLSLY